jgi:tRNA modification GTPase
MLQIFMYREDTIAAVATPPGEGGVAIVRVSGPDAERIAAEIFSRGGDKKGKLRSHTLHHGSVNDPKTGALLDEVLLAVMRGPHSYTGEDVVEIHCHGSPLLTRRLLHVILARGARHAEPGEFTERAFLNGRIDLAQAEAILDLIQARTATGLTLAVQQMHGGLSKWVVELREELLDILAQVEAGIDFPEEDIDLLHKNALVAKIEGLRKKICEILASYEWGRLLREGAKVCIAGRPNVGKSSLLNALLGIERVIVTPEPGTTRDVIEESIDLDGLPVVLWDTAGIRETDNPVEKIGVEFSRRHAEIADATLLVLDGASRHSGEDESLLRATRGKKGVVIINKNDLPQQLDCSWLAEVAPEKPTVAVSAKEGTGIDQLKATLRELLLGIPRADSGVMLTNVRHKACLEKSVEALGSAGKAIQLDAAPDLVTVDLYEARNNLAEVIGEVFHDDILERIFTKFCIGK